MKKYLIIATTLLLALPIFAGSAQYGASAQSSVPPWCFSPEDPPSDEFDNDSDGFSGWFPSGTLVITYVYIGIQNGGSASASSTINGPGSAVDFAISVSGSSSDQADTGGVTTSSGTISGSMAVSTHAYSVNCSWQSVASAGANTQLSW